MSKIGRVSIVVSGHKVVGGLIGQAREVTMALSDREANGEAFPDERLVRLPRRMCKVRPTEDHHRALERIERWTHVASAATTPR